MGFMERMQIRLKLFFLKRLIGSIHLLQKLIYLVFAEPAPPQRCVLAIIEEGQRILVSTNALFHKYSFPGGSFRSGERPYAAVVREVQEETGLQVVPVRMVGCYESYQGVHAINMVYHCRPAQDLDEERIKRSNCSWFDIDSIYSLLPTHCQMAIADYRSGLQGGKLGFS